MGTNVAYDMQKGQIASEQIWDFYGTKVSEAVFLFKA